MGRSAIGVLAALVAACSTYEPKPTAAPTEPLVPAASPAVEKRVGLAENLDHLGNLKGSDVRVLGFEMPMGAKSTGKGISRFIAVDEDRLLRFFKSRGFLIEELNRSTYRVAHTPRTLELLTADEAERVEPAKIFMGAGPGSGFTLKFNKGRATERMTLRDELAEAERQHDAAFQKAAARAAKLREAKLKAAKPAEDKEGPKGFGGVPLDKKLSGKAMRGQAPKRKTYSKSDLMRLRAKAARKPMTPRQKEQWDKIRAWERKTGEVFRH